MSARLVFLSFVLVWLSGCSVQQPPATPFAYGVRPTDWVIEEESIRCAQACSIVRDDQKMLCMSECPGFVVAQVNSCQSVPTWKECRMANVPQPTRPTYSSGSQRAERRRANVGGQIAVGTIRVIGAVISAALEADSSDDDDRRKRTRSKRGKKRSRAKKGKSRTKRWSKRD